MAESKQTNQNKKTETPYLCKLKCLFKGTRDYNYGSYKALWTHEQTVKHDERREELEAAGVLNQFKLGLYNVQSEIIENDEAKKVSTSKRSRVSSAKAVLKKIMKTSFQKVSSAKPEIPPKVLHFLETSFLSIQIKTKIK